MRPFIIILFSFAIFVKCSSNPKAEVKKEIAIEYYVVEDSDGWSNLRETPGGAILKKVYDYEKFEVIGHDKKHKKVKLSDGTTGYIHKSRVVNLNNKICECIKKGKKLVDANKDYDPVMGWGLGGGDRVTEAPELSLRLEQIFMHGLCPKGCESMVDLVFSYDSESESPESVIERCISITNKYSPCDCAKISYKIMLNGGADLVSATDQKKLNICNDLSSSSSFMAEVKKCPDFIKMTNYFK